MNPWEWLWQFEEDAVLSGDRERLRLAQIYVEAHRISNDNPAAKLALYEIGRDLATQLQEPWWELFYEHWAIEVLLYGLQKPKIALDRVVRAVVEARKPQYDAFPQRTDLHLNLIGAYMGIDPIGYEAKLREAFAHIKIECDYAVEKQAYHAQLWGYFLEMTRSESAVEAAWDYLALAEAANSEHFQWDALHLLCLCLFRFDLETAHLELEELASFGEEVARRESQNRGVAAFLMWRALAARWNGDETGAARWYRRAWETQKRSAPPQIDVHVAAIAWHRAGGDDLGALRICQQSLRILRRHELHFHEAQRRVEKCEILAAMGRDLARELKRLERVAQKLPSKAFWESEILRLKAI
ncbi:MAG TPA: hypothetical protein VGB45_15690 [Abditibacterium sp.]|jgi:hypothetical protein